MLSERVALAAWLKDQAEQQYANMPKLYVFKAKCAKEEKYLPALVKNLEPLRLTRKWINKDDFERVAAEFGHAVDGASQEQTVLSVVYYRHAGMLLSVAGSGAHLVKANSPITDEEWEFMQMGFVTSKLKNAVA
jgi:hypothetical protein